MTAAKKRPTLSPRLIAMVRRAIALLVTVLVVAGCAGALNGVPRGIACPAFSLKYGWAVKVSQTGSVQWRTRLVPAASAGMMGAPARPVILGGIAVVATESDDVYGLRLADGRLLWTWSSPQSIFGRWLWHSTLVVETAGLGGPVTLTGLDALTGQVRWSAGLGTDAAADQLVTADGSLTFLTNPDVLETVQLSTGRILWSVPTAVSPPMEAPALAVGDGVVVFVLDGRATGYDDRTGRMRWTLGGLPAKASVWSTAGLVLVTSAFAGGPSAVLTAISAGTGQVAWRFGAPVNLAATGDDGGLGPLGLIGSGPAGLLVGDSVPGRVYLLNPATGQPRWEQDAALPGIRASIAAPVYADEALPGFAASIITPSDVISVEGASTAKVVDRDAAGGLIRWRTAAGEWMAAGGWMAAAGSVVVIEAAGGGTRDAPPGRLRAYRLSSGELAWQASLPRSLPTSLTSVPGGVLAETSVPGPPVCGGPPGAGV